MIARILAGAVASCLLLATAAFAQPAYPTKPIRLVVPFAVGGATDVIGRIIGAKMSEILGQQVLVDNRAGAGGNIGADIVAKAAPDGYTILAATGSTHTMNPVLYPKIPYDPIRDFSPVGQLVITPFVLVINKDVPATDLKSLLALVKANPGKYNYGSSGVGTNVHLCSELMRKMAGNLDLAHVPYRGSGPLMNDLIAGQITMALDAAATSAGHIQSGAIRAIGTAMPARIPTMPTLATMAEQGLPGFECYTWTGIFGPAKMSAAVIKRLNDVLNQVLNDKAVAERLSGMGFEPTPNTTPEKLALFTKAELDKWTPIIKASGVQLD